ncbi:DUF58 domain-containing protein [Nocardioides zeae]|uniref:DUF58 domain-containing protein n=1 Tax=Nocardioides imazamoxiresistens TaxID=3231893 RepID=A0ABU3PZ24_9ACTN|nr:DUF58 domain-containing protein [Nocardioides zeae]MDT9594498.1 DUF58 domain-containing protein [Nocardioides zeae]
MSPGARPRTELSVRGRAFVAAGLTAVACAVVLGQPALVGAGVFACAVPLVSLLTTRSGRLDVHVRRALVPGHVDVGAPAQVSLAIGTAGAAPRGVLLVEDRVPYVLGQRARVVVRGVHGAWHDTVTYEVRPEVRGRYEVGPASVRARDSFGMVEAVRGFSRTSTLTVRPRATPLPRIRLEGGSGASGEDRPRAAAVGSAEDASVREYRRGDDLRRVHWRTTARTGDLMVRREEDPWQAHATVLLDNRASAHDGQGLGSSLEHAVELAASICAHLCREGYTVHLVDANGTSALAGPGTGGAAAALDLLAVVGLSTRTDLARFGDHSRGGERHVTVAVLGRAAPGDPTTLAGVARRGTTTLAAVLDVERWALESPAGDASAPPRWLASQGWRSTAVGPHDPPDRVWGALGRRRR